METLCKQLGVYRNEMKREFAFPWEVKVQLVKEKNFGNEWNTYRMFVIEDNQDNLRKKEFERLVTESGNIVFFDGNTIRAKGKVNDIEILKSDGNRDFTIARLDRCIKNIDTCKNIIVRKMLEAKIKHKNPTLKIDREIPELRKSSILAIEGCPGAGKSTLCSKLIRKYSSKYRFLYLAPTHEQIQNMLMKLENKGFDIVIMSDESKLNSQMTKYHNSNRKGYSIKQKNVIPTDANIILSTINKPLKGLSSLDKTIVVIDEAGKVSVIEALAAIYMINKLVFLVLAGDSRQLGCHSNNNTYIESCLEYVHRCDAEVWDLRNQFRFGQNINYPMSLLFYDGKMIPEEQKLSKLIYIEVIDCSHEKQMSCRVEAGVVKTIFDHIKDSYQTQVITPYIKQQECLETFGISALSIDGSQGSEFEATIVSLGRNSGRGFLTKQRLNVAFTRSALLLFIIAHADLRKSIPEVQIIYQVAKINDNIVYFRSKSKCTRESSTARIQVRSGRCSHS